MVNKDPNTNGRLGRFVETALDGELDRRLCRLFSLRFRPSRLLACSLVLERPMSPNKARLTFDKSGGT